MVDDDIERMIMYWVEEPDGKSVTELSNSQILENIAYASKRFEYLYCRELRRLEKLQSTAIIKNLEEFKAAQTMYFQTKSMNPKVWFENWEVFKEITKEACRRNLVLTENGEQLQEKLLCFG